MKRMRYPKHLWEPRSSAPHACVMLTFDPGKKTGWSIFLCGVVHDFGAFSVDDQLALDNVCCQAAVLSETTALPLMVVAERWSKGGPHMTHATTASLGASWGKCDAAVRRVGVAKSHIVRVLPVMWQSAVFGGRVENTKKEARVVASYVCGRDCGGDAADAVCIGLWGVSAPDVWHAIPRRLRVAGSAYEAELAAMEVKRAEYRAKQAAKAAGRVATL